MNERERVYDFTIYMLLLSVINLFTYAMQQLAVKPQLKAERTMDPLKSHDRKGCRKREESIGGDEEGPSEIKNQPLRYGYVSILGRRRVMDDHVVVMPPQTLPGGYSFFAAYGGCGRAAAAESCADKLHHCLGKLREQEGLDLGKVVMDCFSCLYENWNGQEAAEREGTSEAAAADGMVKFTAVVVAGEKGEVVVVNCGGSRAVLWSGGVALPLGSDHKPDGADVRFEAQGAIMAKNGVLVSTSKTRGDQGKRRWEPVLTVVRRHENSDDFVIIASDGLWKVVDKEMACEVVEKCLGTKMRQLPSDEGAASQAAAILAELAIAKGSEDNVTVIVVHLNSA